MHRTVLVALLAAGCTGGGDILSDYALQLKPRVPANQDPFADAPQVSVVVRDAMGGTTITTLGTLESGSLEGEEFGPLDRATVGILLQEASAAQGAYSPRELVAYGEVGPITLGADGEDVAWDVLLPEFGGVGELGTIDGMGSLLAAAAMTSSGHVYLFGGASRAGSSSIGGFDRVRELAPLDDGDWTVSNIAELDHDLVAATADVVRGADGEELIFVAGGRQHINGYNGSSDWFLFDPATGDIVDADDNLYMRHAEHASLVLHDGLVLLAGGLYDPDGSYIPAQTYIEIFDPTRGEPKVGINATELAPMGLGVASLGTEGALLCGGGIVTDGGTTFVPNDACQVLSLTGALKDVSPLPSARMYHTLTPLPDGRILACGGVGVSHSDTGGGTPSSTAWVYDPVADQWQVAGSMEAARTGHIAVPTLDGRVIVVGGTSDGAYFAEHGAGTPVTCPEVFDPETMSFEVMGTCSRAGSGALPSVAWHPDFDAVVFEGIDDRGAGGEDYGVVGLGIPTYLSDDE